MVIELGKALGQIRADVVLHAAHQIFTLHQLQIGQGHGAGHRMAAVDQAVTEEQAQIRLAEFARKWDSKYPTISKSWTANWQRVIPFFAYPADIRRIIYTTNAIESLNNSLKKTIKNRASFPNDEAAIKLLYLSLKNIMKKWTMPVRNWGSALNQFAVLYGDRMPIS